jgi:uncharacterized membrane protein
MIDWNIRFGDILVVASLAGTVLVFAYKTGAFTESVNAMKKEMEGLKDVATSISDVLGVISVQKKEIEFIWKTIDELKRGRGWIQGERGVNGEYPK